MATKAEILCHMKQWTDAVALCDRIMEIDDERHAKMDRATELLERVGRAEALCLRDIEAERELERLEEELRSEGVGKRMVGQGPVRHTGIHLLQAEAYDGMEQWDDVKKVYVFLLQLDDFYEASTPQQQRAVFLGLSKCAFHQGVYDKSIAASEAAIEMNRHYPWAHKYKALSQKAQGDLKGAVETMNRAALYETPWDDNHREQVLKLYYELKAELDATEC